MHTAHVADFAVDAHVVVAVAVAVVVVVGLRAAAVTATAASCAVTVTVVVTVFVAAIARCLIRLGHAPFAVARARSLSLVLSWRTPAFERALSLS